MLCHTTLLTEFTINTWRNLTSYRFARITHHQKFNICCDTHVISIAFYGFYLSYYMNTSSKETTTYLEEANILCALTEALTAEVHSVLANKTVIVTTAAAKSWYRTRSTNGENAHAPRKLSSKAQLNQPNYRQIQIEIFSTNDLCIHYVAIVINTQHCQSPKLTHVTAHKSCN